jgi:hypothetical protein
LIGRKLLPAATQQVLESLHEWRTKKILLKSATESMPDADIAHQSQSGPAHARVKPNG